MDRFLHFLKSSKVLLFFLLLTASLGVASNWYLFQEHRIPGILSTFWSRLNHPYTLALIPAITLANIGLRYLKWIFLLRTFRMAFPSRTIFLYYLISFIGNLTPFYFLYLIRIIPLYEKRRNGILVLTLDVALDFIAVFILSERPEWALPAAAGFLITILAASLLRGTHTNSIPVRALSVTSMLLCSMTIWYFTATGLSLISFSFNHPIPTTESAKILASANLRAALSFIPAGIYVNGASMIQGLEATGLDHVTAMIATAIYRGMTLWLAVGVGIITLFIFRRNLRADLHRENHFNIIADEYGEQIPAHIRDRMLSRKIDVNKQWLPRPEFTKGLDGGCGQGWYLSRMEGLGYDMYGIDFSSGQVEKARTNNPRLPSERIHQGSIAGIPFPNETFDFAYTINVLHHLPDRQAQLRAYQEFFRVLKPGGRLIIHEINVRNPLFRLYMSYIFPLINTIDEGTEIWILDRDRELQSIFRMEGREFFTFLPEFLPLFIMKLLQPFERLLETLAVTRKLSAHYALILRKPG